MEYNYNASIKDPRLMKYRGVMERKLCEIWARKIT